MLKDEQVRAALLAHKGDDAHLSSWTADSFTKEADNYSSIILSLKISFRHLGRNCEVSYVAKLSPSHEDDISVETSHVEFTKDSGFYRRILPRLSSILTGCGIQDIRVPHCYLMCQDKGKELMIMEDLREREFRMHDRKISLNVAHTNLVLEELAKLHASSYLLQIKDPSIDLRDMYPDLLKTDRKYRTFIDQIILISVKNALGVLRKFGSCEEAEKWLEKNAAKCIELIYEQLTDVSPFDVVCQGDCWNNNFLFRYNENNEPVEVMLLDFQDLRKSSLATELNELMYTSLDGHSRKTHLDSFLTTYYEAFKRVMEASGTPMPFSIQELGEEYKRKQETGLLLGLVTVPWMVSGEEGLQWYEGSPEDEEQLEAFRSELEMKTVQKFKSNPLLWERFLSLFDCVAETGIV